MMVCTFILDPNLGTPSSDFVKMGILTLGTERISELYPSAISPHPYMIGLYVVGVYVLQVGYCILLVFSRTPETKRAVVKGCGFPLMLSNWMFALWAISWASC